MHLKAKRDITVFHSGNPFIRLLKDETIHTENSHKFDKSAINNIGSWAGLKVEKILSDDNQWFSLVYYKK
jgi:L-histidine N-alpha-methyltransferase